MLFNTRYYDDALKSSDTDGLPDVSLAQEKFTDGKGNEGFLPAY